MTKQKRKLIATFKGAEGQAFEDDRVELTGKYRKGVYELYMAIEESNESIDGRGLRILLNPFSLSRFIDDSQFTH
jgi:hypothetical protein